MSNFNLINPKTWKTVKFVKLASQKDDTARDDERMSTAEKRKNGACEFVVSSNAANNLS